MATSDLRVPVVGLFETHLTVSDLERAVAFYRDVVGLALAYELPERAPHSSGSACPVRRCSVSGCSGPPRWPSRCTWPSPLRWMTFWMPATGCDHGASRRSPSSGA